MKKDDETEILIRILPFGPVLCWFKSNSSHEKIYPHSSGQLAPSDVGI